MDGAGLLRFVESPLDCFVCAAGSTFITAMVPNDCVWLLVSKMSTERMLFCLTLAKPFGPAVHNVLLVGGTGVSVTTLF